jgi:hypothetical protein
MSTEAFDFNSPIPSQEQPTLPQGDATFFVKKMRRVKKERGSLGTCWIAELVMQITPHDGSEPEQLTDELVLHTKLGFRLYQFFAAIGQYAHGTKDPFQPKWDEVEGATGYCSIKHRPWTSPKDGTSRIFVEVDKYFDAEGRSRESDEPRTFNAPKF